MKPILLDLFCCAGGAAMGYHQAGFDVVGVDINPQPRYPFRFVQMDALEALRVLLAGRFITDSKDVSWLLFDFDAIHASPPCQAYSEATPVQHRGNHPDLIAPTRKLLQATGKPYVIENVENARHLLVNPVKLCGSMFGLPTFRHRYFEVWPGFLMSPAACAHNFRPLLVTTAGANSRRTGNHKSTSHAPAAYGIDWMIGSELAEAIPPAYTEWLGRHLMTVIESEDSPPAVPVRQHVAPVDSDQQRTLQLV